MALGDAGMLLKSSKCRRCVTLQHFYTEAALETTPPEQSPAEPAPTGDVYEDQGSGWYFRKLPDGTYDQQVYVIKDGFYVPYEGPNV